MKERSCEWLISPGRGTETNEKLTGYLGQEGLITESQPMDQIQVNGKTVYGWFVPHRIINEMNKAERVFTFKFRVYKKEGGGEWKEDRFLQKKGRVSVRSKAAQAQLKEIRARKE